MKKLMVVLVIGVLLMASCNLDDDNGSADSYPTPKLNRSLFDEQWEAWTERGISNYSFDVYGIENKPNWLITSNIEIIRNYKVPLDVLVYAHVTVENGEVVKIENLGPDQRPSQLFVAEGFDEEVGGTYSWGTISDIYEKIYLLSREEESSPFVYTYSTLYDSDNYNIPFSIDIAIQDRTMSPNFSAGDMVLFYQFRLKITNFQVTE